jgi:hypothetical protein
MNERIITVTFAKCGTCIYAQKFDAKDAADCFGYPPTVILLGATKDVLGRPGVQLETFVPRVQKDRAGCSLHKRKDDFATQGSS